MVKIIADVGGIHACIGTFNVTTGEFTRVDESEEPLFFDTELELNSFLLDKYAIYGSDITFVFQNLNS